MIFQVCISLLCVGQSLNAQLIPLPVQVRVAVVDSTGFLYVAGDLTSATLPTTPGVLQPGPPRDCSTDPAVTTCRHGFVAKIAPSGDTLVWATYFAGDGQDTVSAIAVDPDGNVFIAGPTTSKTLLPAIGGYRWTPASLFLAKLSSDGRSLMAATYFGGQGSDGIAALKLDSNGNVYIAGTAASDGFPSTGPRIPTPTGPSGNPLAGCSGTDQFVAKFNGSLSRLSFSALIGSTWLQTTSDLALGSDGTVYVAGTRGKRDCQSWPILTRLIADGSAAVYSVLASGPAGAGLAVAADGTAYFGSDNREYPVSAPEGSIFKVDPSGRMVAKQTVLGLVKSLAVSANGEVVVLGMSRPRRLELTPGAPGFCVVPAGSANRALDLVPYLARFEASALASRYTRYVTADGAWLAGPDQMIVARPYTTLLPFAVLATGAPPPGTVTCAANAANYDSRAVSPGEVISLFGNQIGSREPAGARLDAEGNVTSEIGGVRVSAAGLPAPLLYASPNQINLVLPFGLAVSDKVRLEITRDGILIAAFEKRLTARHPGLFHADGSGLGQLAALNEDGTVNNAANPARPGAIVSIFATGLGAMTPAPIDGARPTQAVSRPVVVPQVLVNQQPAQIEYIGNAPMLVQGVVQINFRLPDPISTAFSQSPNSPWIALQDSGDPGGILAVR
jgi:uncharacterized protein (TIGR03437 family)